MAASERIRRMQEITHAAHGSQTRNGGRIPYWVHTDGVAQLVESALRRGCEISEQDGEDLVLAGYGHDLYEDTAVTPEQIRAEFGDRVAQLISGLTNDVSDQDRVAYLAKLTAASDEVRMVKSADLADNMLSVAYGLHDVGLDWTRQFFLPIADETRNLLLARPFDEFPVTGGLLLELVEFAWARLSGAVDTATGQSWAQPATAQQV